MRILESGVASAADINRAMVLGCGHPLGPLGLIDLIGPIGLDIIASVGQSTYEELKDPQYAPPHPAAAHDRGRLPAPQKRPGLPRLLPRRPSKRHGCHCTPVGRTPGHNALGQRFTGLRGRAGGPTSANTSFSAPTTSCSADRGMPASCGQHSQRPGCGAPTRSPTPCPGGPGNGSRPGQEQRQRC
ncbi:3-hydroxyacyl-CoA dehydrogenase family protein [Amycolatopsis sp. H20-H5]|uniref:3-hydroxyacyl-CoA dehydrogenase family protein n=1 Tax=Amycolatopsis sp. H20-H5 TaxID=3046309 RepID=UPI002DB83BC6|nr:3-hydroxyacyl-CoA dehydrogenase family protein [Amycolatopsis sp. H20-H5]MEC3976991.1 3-hydroxyacyl-CoA dehydrogenase family protein [Amycolatopsis sp. H20-H5]